MARTECAVQEGVKEVGGGVEWWEMSCNCSPYCESAQVGIGSWELGEWV